MTQEEAYHAFLDGLQPRLWEHIGTHVKGDLEAAIAMASRMEVFRPASKPKARSQDKKGDKSHKNNKNRQGGNAQVEGSTTTGNVNAVQRQGQKKNQQGQGHKKKDRRPKRKLQCHNCGGEHLLRDCKEWKEIKDKLCESSSSGNQ